MKAVITWFDKWKWLLSIGAVVVCAAWFISWMNSGDEEETGREPTEVVSTETISAGPDDGIVRLTDFGWSVFITPSQLNDVRVAVIFFGALIIGALLFVRREHGKLQFRMPVITDVWRGSFAAVVAAIAYNIVWAIGDLAGNVDTFTTYALTWAYVGIVLILAVIVWPLAKEQEWARRWTGIVLVVVGIVLMFHISVYKTYEDLPMWVQTWFEESEDESVLVAEVPRFPEGVMVRHHPGYDQIVLAAGAVTPAIVLDEKVIWDGEPGTDGHFIIINNGGPQWVATENPDIHLTNRGQMQFMGGPEGSTILLYSPRMYPR